MGFLGLNTEAICFGDAACIAKRDSDINASQANSNALNAIANNSGKGEYNTIIIISIISFVSLIIVGSLLYLKTKNKI